MNRAAAVFLAALLCVAPAASAPLEPAEISVRHIPNFRIGSSETRFGALDYIGGVEMVSRHRQFGGLSGFRWLTPGERFLAVTDTGYWVRGRVARDDHGRVDSISEVFLQQMVDRQGRGVENKDEVDAEGLSVEGDRATVVFEREHRVTEYGIGPEGMTGPLRDLDFVVPRRELRRNAGFEMIARAPAGGTLDSARIIVSEFSIDHSGNIFGAIIDGPGKGLLTVAPSGDFRITDGAFLPGGDLILLERSFAYTRGVAMQLRRIEGRTIRPGALLDGEVLYTANMAYQIDNMEALDIWRRADGRLVLTVLSDDNFSFLQRNLMIEFLLEE